MFVIIGRLYAIADNEWLAQHVQLYPFTPPYPLCYVFMITRWFLVNIYRSAIRKIDVPHGTICVVGNKLVYTTNTTCSHSASSSSSTGTVSSSSVTSSSSSSSGGYVSSSSTGASSSSISSSSGSVLSSSSSSSSTGAAADAASSSITLVVVVGVSVSFIVIGVACFGYRRHRTRRANTGALDPLMDGGAGYTAMVTSPSMIN